MRCAFRRMIPSDLSEVLDLWAASWSEAYHDIDFEARRAWFTDHLANWQKDGGDVWLQVQSGALVGLLCLNSNSGHLDQICVSTSQKGSGAADALMAHACAVSPLGLHLDVNADNARAIRFYQRHGFEKTGEGINPNSGRPKLLMRWQP
jgi:putative acetyltransferase